MSTGEPSFTDEPDEEKDAAYMASIADKLKSKPASNASKPASNASKPASNASKPTSNASAPAPATPSNSELLAQAKKDLLVAGSLSVQQADESSPLHSAESFESLQLRQELLQGIHAMKFSRPSKVQGMALPLLLKDPPENMLAQSQSGTGKTAAFVLAMLSRVDVEVDSPQGVCMAPTRELARQTYDVVMDMGRFMKGLRVLLVVPEAKLPPPGSPLDYHILVATPGSMSRLSNDRPTEFAHMHVLVFDEADQMFDETQGSRGGRGGRGGGRGGARGGGRGGESLAQQAAKFKKLCEAHAKQLQVLLFSATFEGRCKDWSLKAVPEPRNVIMLKTEELAHKHITQYYIRCKGTEKAALLSDLLKFVSVGSAIIFVNRRDTANSLHGLLDKQNHTIAHLAGELTPTDRDKVIDDFRSGKSRLLIATNVAARGIDVDSVSMVINYDMPLMPGPDGGINTPDPTTYLHRIGRTGRFGRSGIAVSFVTSDAEVRVINEIVSSLGTKVTDYPKDDIAEMQEMLEGLGY